MTELAVFGLGSAHGDDRLGWEVVQRIQALSLPGVELRAISAPSAGLLTQLMQYSHVILVDAVDCCAAAGSLFHYKETDIEQVESLQALSSHHIGLPELLQLTRALDLRLPPLDVFAVQIEDCQPMAPMSVAVEAAIPELISQICDTIRESSAEHV